jgi:hypothetical protein
MKHHGFFMRYLCVILFVVAPQLVRAQSDAAPNPNCSLIVPANPLSAEGLATPYQLVATDPPPGVTRPTRTVGLCAGCRNRSRDWTDLHL